MAGRRDGERQRREADWRANDGVKQPGSTGGAFPREVIERIVRLRWLFPEKLDPVPGNKIVKDLIMLAAIRPSFQAALDDMVHLGLNVPDWKEKLKMATGAMPRDFKDLQIGGLVESVMAREGVDANEACELVACRFGVRAAKKPGGSFGNAILSVKRAYKRLLKRPTLPASGVIMGYDDEIFPVRLAELRRKRMTIWFGCNDCQKQGHIDPATLDLPDNMLASDVHEHLPCPHCGSRNMSTAGYLK